MKIPPPIGRISKKKMSDRTDTFLSTTYSFVITLHNNVRGRGRYKIKGLWANKNLKSYLESQLSTKIGIIHVSANPTTGNILVRFESKYSHQEIAFLLHKLVLEYREQKIKDAKPIAKAILMPQYKFDRRSQLLVWTGEAIGTLVLCTALLQKYGLDNKILLAIQKLHSPLLDRAMLGITFLGEPITLLLVILGLAIGPLRDRHRSDLAALNIAAVSAVSLNYWLKGLFARARPTLWDWIIEANHHSFPSGHAMMSVTTYGFISYILAKQYPQRQREIFVCIVVLISAIGFSRLYLGVHWPSDVVAGYAVGLAWAIACILCLEIWQQKQFPYLSSIK
jgi:membrane-associated phospholipid phosphatase